MLSGGILAENYANGCLALVAHLRIMCNLSHKMSVRGWFMSSRHIDCRSYPAQCLYDECRMVESSSRWRDSDWM